MFQKQKRMFNIDNTLKNVAQLYREVYAQEVKFCLPE